MVHMDGVLHDTTRESVNAIADTNSAFSGCCQAPHAQFLFITGSLNAVSALIFLLGFFLPQITPDTANQGTFFVICTKMVFGYYILKNEQFLPLIFIFTPLFGGVKGTYWIST